MATKFPFDFHPCYNEKGKLFYKLEHAIGFDSKTICYPFIIAHECKKIYTDRDGNVYERNREYYAFHDIYHFIFQKADYPHSHEILLPRIDNKIQGRLVFDLDIKKRSYCDTYGKISFVSPTFKDDFEWCIQQTFNEYYTNVNTEKFEYMWQYTDHRHEIDIEELKKKKEKYGLDQWSGNPSDIKDLKQNNTNSKIIIDKKLSKHLTIKNAYFCEDWIEQSQLFYNLLIIVMKRSNLFYYINDLKDLIDFQVIKVNTTMRIPYNRKIDGKIMFIEDITSTDIENTITNPYYIFGINNKFFDTLIQLHRPDDIDIEQHISRSLINKNKLIEESISKGVNVNTAAIKSSTKITKYYENIKTNSVVSTSIIKDSGKITNKVIKCANSEDRPRLIRLNKKYSSKSEISISHKNTKSEETDNFETVLRLTDIKPLNKSKKYYNISFNCSDEELIKKYKCALKIFNRDNNGVFEYKDTLGAIINLRRVSPAQCLISGIEHEKENAYLYISDSNTVYFYCRRGCKPSSNSKAIKIGSINDLLSKQDIYSNFEDLDHDNETIFTLHNNSSKYNSIIILKDIESSSSESESEEDEEEEKEPIKFGQNPLLSKLSLSHSVSQNQKTTDQNVKIIHKVRKLPVVPSLNKSFNINKTSNDIVTQIKKENNKTTKVVSVLKKKSIQ